MLKPIQLAQDRDQQVAAFAARKRAESAAAARDAIRARERLAELEAADIEATAWEEAAARLLDDGRELFGSEKAARHEMAQILDARERAARPRPSDDLMLRKASRKDAGNVSPWHIMIVAFPLFYAIGAGIAPPIPIAIAVGYVCFRVWLHRRKLPKPTDVGPSA